MLCERCSEVVRPVVLVDIDGTLADYHSHLAWFICHYFDIPFEQRIRRHMFNDMGICQWDGWGNFEDWLGITQAQYREAKLAFRQGGMKRTMPIYGGAQEMVRSILSHDVEVWVTTTRPWQRLDNVDPDTREWLRRHNIGYHRLLFDDDKYRRVTQIIDRDRIICVFDDLPEQYDACIKLSLPVWQVSRQHNSGPGQRRPNRGTLAAGVGYALRNLTSWRNEYELQS